MRNYLLSDKFVILVLSGLISYSCNQMSQEASAGETKNDSTNLNGVSAAEVEIMVAHLDEFDHEIVSNGKAAAAGKADLYFNPKEMIRRINYENGDRVRQGDTIAALENHVLKIRVEQARLAFEKAELNLYDLLIGQGYDYNDLSSIPGDILKKAKIKSGYTGSQNELELARAQYNESFLLSPMDGVIANLYEKENNYPAGNRPFCTVINNRQFEIVFKIMESEIHLVKTGEQVAVHPYHDESIRLTGRVSQVNPVIDENGLVNITARVNNKDNSLYEGMNVKVFLKSPVKNKITVPKEAVTIRSEKPVVFTLKNNTAQWNYVTTGAENSTSIVIEDGILGGDSVIYKGNIHLANGTEVVVVE